jgi:ssRNA-specific RNase YbeY (16S rRNA maturation enzyme)
MLHLLGYDHHGSLEATATMRAREEAVMEELGLGRKPNKTE